MGKKKKLLTQADLDKMSPEEVIAIQANQIEDGYDITHTDGSNPKLVQIGSDPEPSTDKVDESTEEPTKETAEEIDEASKPKPKPKDESKPEDNKGILFLRFFKRDDNNGKILTRLKRKVYFPKDSLIEPGWYIATILEERSNHGVMDTIALSNVADSLWNPRYIKGIYVHRNHKENQLEIFPAIPKDQLENQQPTLIHTVQLPDPYKGSGNTIGEILAAKKEQAKTDKLG